jgi:hypothetical protein
MIASSYLEIKHKHKSRGSIRISRLGWKSTEVLSLSLFSALTPAITRGVIGLKRLEGTVLSDYLINVRRRGVLDTLARYLAGKDERKGIASLSDTGSTILLNGSGTLCSGSISSILSHFSYPLV